MAKKQNDRTRRSSPVCWLQRLFRQPPRNFYGQTSVYLSGRTLEIEQVRRVRSYEEGKLCLELAHGTLTVYGNALSIVTLSAHRITLRGEILRTEFIPH